MTDVINISKIEESIDSLTTYVKEGGVDAVIAVLKAIKANPEDLTLLDQLSDSMTPLGVWKGAVLNYAPYVAILMSRDLFEDD